MYARSTILTEGTSLVGWRQSSDSLYSDLSTANKASTSGYYVNDIPGITVNLLNYVNNETNASDYLTNAHNSELLKLIDSFIAKQKDNLNTKELLQHNTLLQTYNELDMPISRSGRFIGYAISPRESKTITSKILEIGFMSAGAQTFTLYLYDTSHKAAIETKEITLTAEDTIEWTELNWDISFDRDAGSAGQIYLIGYYENDLAENLYEQDWTGACAHQTLKIFGHYMGVDPVRFRSSTLNGIYIPNPKYIRSSSNCKTPGFNLRFNTKCDITRIIKDNILIFAEALQYSVAIRILNDALSYTELNNITNASILRARWEDLLTEYNGRLNGGITAAGIPIKGMIDRLSVDFSEMDMICLKERRGQITKVKWR